MSTPKHIVIDARIRRSSTGRYTDRLMAHLQTIDTVHRYTILLEPDDDWQPTAANFRPLPCPYAQFSLNPLQQFGFARMLYRLKPDVVHFTMTQQPLLYFGRIVTTTHDLTMFRFVRRGSTSKPVFALKMWLYRFLFKWSHFKSDKIIVPTNFVAGDLADYQPSAQHKIIVTYEDSEPPLKSAAVRPAQLNDSDQFIMYLGNAFPHKNLERLIEAFDILHKKHPRLKLVLTGKKEIHYQELEQKIRQHPAAGSIIVTGFLPDEQAKWLYEHTRAYVFPSVGEGFGLPALEAMRHGAPVVSSNATCLPEVCGPGAHYFDPFNSSDIAQKVDEVLTDKKLRGNLVRNGKTQAGTYSWKHMANQTLTIYKELLGETIDA